jgi:hydrogenase nickel incorporation protein HypA/HybF
LHETAIAENIIDIVTSEMSKHGLTKVQSIKLRIGEMSHVMPDALIFGFDVMSKGTPLEDAKLIIESLATKGLCKKCETEFIIKDMLDVCPKCENPYFEIISGKELEITEFDGS